jgi:hypothetical protein
LVKDFKNELVISLYKQRGPFWEAVKEVRERWSIVAKAERPPTTPLSTLPSPGDFLLLPEGAPDYYAAYEEWHNFSSRWHLDIFRIQQQTMPEKYGGEDWWPQWRNFLSACVLYDPPREDLLAFAAYDNELDPDLVLPLGELEYTDSDDPSELPRMVASPVRSLGDLVRPHDWFWIERFWELLEQLKPLGFDHKSLVHDILLVLERREEYLLKIEQNQSSRFIEVDEHTTVKDAERAARLITAAQKERPVPHAPPRARLLALQCAVDYELPEWTYKKLAERYDLGSPDTAKRYVEDGQKILEEP